MWVLSSSGSDNLRSSDRVPVTVLLIAIAVVIGAASGGLVGRRKTRVQIVLFGCIAGGAGGAVCGAAYALVMGIAFVGTYGGTPVNAFDAILVGLSYPVFALLGGMVGIIPGALLGACGGYLVAHRAPLA